MLTPEYFREWQIWWYSKRLSEEKQKGNTKAVEHLENDLKRFKNITR